MTTAITRTNRTLKSQGLHVDLETEASGNVREWCKDLTRLDDENNLPPYSSGNASDPEVTEGDRRVCRGGAWFLDYSRLLRVSYRPWRHPANRGDAVGFRVACSPQDP